MAKARRFVSRTEMKVERLPWGPHDWLVRPDVVDAEELLVVRVHMPKGKAHAFHRHPHMEKVIYVLEGRAEQWVGEEKRILGPGDVAHIPKDEVHGTYNVGQGVLRLLMVMGPASFKGKAFVDVSGEEPWATLHETLARRAVAKPARRKRRTPQRASGTNERVKSAAKRVKKGGSRRKTGNTTRG